MRGILAQEMMWLLRVYLFAHVLGKEIVLGRRLKVESYCIAFAYMCVG